MATHKNRSNPDNLVNKAKEKELPIYNEFSSKFGSIDVTSSMKSIYLNFQSFAELLEDYDDQEEIDSIIRKKRKKVINYISELNNNNFQREAIVAIEFRTNGDLIKGRRIFLNVDVTIFTTNQIDLLNKVFINYMEQISCDIIDVLHQLDSVMDFKRKGTRQKKTPSELSQF